MSAAPLLEIENLTLRFGQVEAAAGESLVLMPGEFVGIIGPNGAGKTTLLNLITGYLRPESGSIRFQGRPIVGLPPEVITGLGIGRSFQVPQLFASLPVLENVLIALATPCGGDRDAWTPMVTPARERTARALLGQFGLQEWTERPAAELPEGGRKLLDVALAAALRPKLLLLDEPTSGVSAEDKYPLMDTLVAVLEREGVTTAFVEHDMDVVRRYARRVVVLSEGRIIADGPPARVLDDGRGRGFLGG